MPTLEELTQRIAALETSAGIMTTLTGQVDEVARQLQRLQGGSGLLEPQSALSAWDETPPFVVATTGNPTVSYVGQATQLLAGRNIIFERIVNSPYLRVSTGTGLMNVDYVVDSNGFGTHLTLFGSTGALTEAIATGGDRVIWVCTTHTETQTSTTSLNGLQNSQQITIMSGGPFRPYIIRGHSGAMFSMTSTSGASGDPTLRFVGLNFGTSTGTGDQPLITASSGVGLCSFDFEDCGFNSASGTTWTYIVDISGSGSATTGRLYMRRCRDLSETGGTVTGIVKLITASGSGGSFWMEGCEFRGLTTMSFRTGTTEVDWGLAASNQIHGVFIINNVLGFTGATSYMWKRSYNVPLRVVGNHIRFQHTSGYGLVIGTSATTSPRDATVSGNTIHVVNAGGGAIQVSAGAGTASNICITGNSISGPGSGTAITLDVAAESVSDGYSVLNSYRDWTTNVGGTGATGAYSGIDHGSLSGLTDDDHTQYILASGTRALTGDWNAGTSRTITIGKLVVDDSNFYLDEVAGSTVNEGKTTIGGTTRTTGGNNSFATQVTLAGGTYTSMSAYIDLDLLTRGATCAVYTDSAGSPGTLVAATSETTVSAAGTPAWVTFNFATAQTIAAGTYWLAINFNGGGFTWTLYYDAGGAATGVRDNPDTYSDGFESPWAGGTAVTDNYSIYITGAPQNPTLLMDSTDYFNYDRNNNRFGFWIGSAEVARHSTTQNALLGYLRVGSMTAAATTTAGHLSAVSAVIGTDAAKPTGIDLYVPTNAGRFAGALTETAISADRVDIGVNSGTPRILFEDGASATIWEIDNSAGAMRFFVPGTQYADVNTSGFRYRGYISASSGIGAPANTTAGDITGLGLSIGNGAIHSATARTVRISETLTDTASGSVSFALFNPSLSPASASSSEFKSLYFQSLMTNSGGTFNIVHAGYLENRNRTTQTTASMNGLVLAPLVIDSSSPATVGVVSDVRALDVRVFGRPSGTSTVSVTAAHGIMFGANFLSGAGATITDLYNIKMTNPTTNTITTHYGLYIEKLTRATTNVEFYNAGKTVYAPTSQTLAAAGNTIGNSATLYYIDNSTGALLTMTSTPTISVTGAQDGQLLIIINVDTADSIALQDETGLAGSKLRLPGAATLTLGPKDSAMFIYKSSAGEWWCIGSANL